MNRLKLFVVKYTPWWVLRGLWLITVIDRTTIFRWEMNVTMGEWDSGQETPT